MSKIDLEQLRKEIRTMNRTNELYRLLRDELQSRGYWRYRKRGNPAKGFESMKRRENY